MRLEVGLWAHLKNQPNVPWCDGTVTYPTVEITEVEGNRIQVRRVESEPTPLFWVDAKELGQSPWERPTEQQEPMPPWCPTPEEPHE